MSMEMGRSLQLVLKDKLFGNSIYYILTMAQVSILGLVFWLIVAKGYPESVVGINVTITSAIMLVSRLGLIGFPVTLVRVLPKEKDPKLVVSSYCIATVVLSLVFTLIYIALLPHITPELAYLRTNPLFITTCLVLASTISIHLLLQAAFAAERQGLYVLLKELALSVVRVGGAVVLVIYFSSRYLGITEAWTVAFVVGSVVSVLFLKKTRIQGLDLRKFSFSVLRKDTRLSIENFLVEFLIVLPPMLLPIIITNRVGPEQSAFFYMGWMIAYFFFTISLSVGQSLLAEGSTSLLTWTRDIKRAVKFTLLLVVAGTIVAWFLGSTVLDFLGKSYSTESLSLLKILLVSAVPFVGTAIYTTILRVEKRMRELVLLWIISMAVFYTAVFILLPKYGIESTGWSWLGVNTAICIYIGIRRLVK